MTRVLGELGISISSIVQKALIVEHAAAELVILTHPAREADLRTARVRLASIPAVYAIPAFLRAFADEPRSPSTAAAAATSPLLQASPVGPAA